VTRTNMYISIEATLELATAIARANGVEEKIHRNCVNYTIL